MLYLNHPRAVCNKNARFSYREINIIFVVFQYLDAAALKQLRWITILEINILHFKV